KRFHKLEQEYTPSWDGLMLPSEEMSLLFHHTWSPGVHLNGVKNSPELRKAYESIQGDVVATSLKISQSRPIYEGLKKIKEGTGWAQLSEAQRRIINARIVDAELSGIALTGQAQQRFNALSQELSK